MLSGQYNTGNISVANGDTTVTFAGGGLTTTLVAGDPLFAGSSCGMIDSITDSTHLELALPWAGATLTNAAYIVPYLSVQRYSSAYNGQKVRELIAYLDDKGIIYYVPSDQDEPDPAFGNDGDIALQITPGAAWVWWVKTAGVWVSQGSPIGIAWRSAWSSATAYITNDIVSRLGRLYIALTNNTNFAPESNPTKWELLFEGGERYDLMFDASDRPDSGDRFRRAVFSTTVTFPAGLSDSVANCLTPAAASAVFSIRKNNVQFGTLTFSIGAYTGVFAAASDTTFVSGDVLEIIAPNPRDANLADIAITLTGFR